MRLTQFSDYAMRLLIYAAVHRDRLVTIEEVAGVYAISRGHLMKVANTLTRNDLLRAVRGRSGGLALARPPAAIGLGEVLRVTEPDFALVECFGEDSTCRIIPSCRLRGILSSALGAFMAEVDRYTLEDLVLDPAAFGIDRPAA